MIEKVIKNIPQETLDEAIKLHGLYAPGMIIGFKLAQRALKELQPRPEDIITLTSETILCIPDALQCLGRYLLLNGGFHIYSRTFDMGKLSIQVARNQKEFFRLVLNDTYIQENEILNAWANLGGGMKLDQEKLQKAMWNMDLDAAIIKKSFKEIPEADLAKKEIVTCPVCGEKTALPSMVVEDGKTMCKICKYSPK